MNEFRYNKNASPEEEEDGKRRRERVVQLTEIGNTV